MVKPLASQSCDPGWREGCPSQRREISLPIKEMPASMATLSVMAQIIIFLFVNIINTVHILVETVEIRIVGDDHIEFMQGRPFGFEVECVTADGELSQGQRILNDLYSSTKAVLEIRKKSRLYEWQMWHNLGQLALYFS